MDLKILEIAAHTENNKVVENYTHKSKHKNPLCGDEMEISLIVKEDVVKDMNVNRVFIVRHQSVYYPEKLRKKKLMI